MWRGIHKLLPLCRLYALYDLFYRHNCHHEEDVLEKNIASEKDNRYNSKTKNNSKNSEMMRTIQIIGSGKNNHINTSQIK